MSEGGDHRALLVDFGGVLTTDIWESFAAFCAERGLDPAAAKTLFRSNPEALATLRALETGELEQAEFERRFAELLGTDAEGLIAGLFAGLEPEPRMVAAVGAVRGAGIPTALVSNSWVLDHYTNEIRALFDALVISAEGGLHNPPPQVLLLAAGPVG